MIWIYTTEMLLYLCFSLLMGSLLIHLIPSRRKPEVKVSKRVLQLSILGIALLSAAPVIRLILFLYEDVGLILTIQNVIGEFEVGQAWSITLIISIFFYLFVSIAPVFKSKVLIGISLLFTFMLLLCLGWASHAASLTDWSGFVFHTVHFTAATIWVGILLMVSWFSISSQNWLPFLKWFTPVALFCLATISATGLFIMTLAVEVEDYQNAWLMPYGQTILIKHLIILPLLLFAFINGILIRRKLQRGDMINPIPWAKAESVVLLLIFAATGILGQQEPPHSIEAYLRGTGASEIFNYFYAGEIYPSMQLQFDFNIMTLLFMLLGCAFGGLVVLCFKQKAPAYLSLLMGIFCVLAIYAGLMTSIR